MNKIGRLLFFSGSCVLWLFLLALVLEGWARWHWSRIETQNPFVKSRIDEELWPIPRIPENDFSAYLNDADLRSTYRGQGKSLTKLAEPTPEEELLWRFPAFIAQENDFYRHVFANVYGLNILSLTETSDIKETYAAIPAGKGDSLLKAVGEADLEPLVRALKELADSAETHRFVPALSPEHRGPFGYAVLRSPAAEGGGCWLAYPRGEVWQPTKPDTLWELDFFTYKKHMERRDRINALGITEDFRINNYGFRDADLIVPKPAGTYRILCVGASTTEEGPVNDLTYPAILETLLNKHFGFNRIDVVNCGLSGMNSLKHRMRVGDYLALDPDLIVLYNAVNDICHDLYPIWVKNASPLQKRLRESVFLRRYFGQVLLPDRSRMRADIEHSKISNLEFFIRYFREHQVNVALCSFAAPSPDALSRVERDYYEYYTVLEWTGHYSNFECYLTALRLYNEALHGLCEKENVLYIPVEENMRDGVVMFGDICHLRNPGIEKKAGIIADALITRIEKAARL